MDPGQVEPCDRRRPDVEGRRDGHRRGEDRRGLVRHQERVLHDEGRSAPSRTIDEPGVRSGRSRFRNGKHEEPGERQREAPPEAGEPAACSADRPGAPAPPCLERRVPRGETADRPTRGGHHERQDERLPPHRPQMIDPELWEPERHERSDQGHRDGEPRGRSGADDRGGERALLQTTSLFSPRSEGEHDDRDRERTDRDLQHRSRLRRRSDRWGARPR